SETGVDYLQESEFTNYIKSNWRKRSILAIQNEIDINLYSLLQIAFEFNLQDKKTNSIRRHRTKEEDQFLNDYSRKLSIDQACNLLHRSRYATYQRVKLLNLEEMVSKRNTKR